MRLRLAARALLDGAMGTELIARGLDPASDCAERWTLDEPADVRAIHRHYQAAGAEVLTTNTFGGNRRRLARFGMGQRVREVNVTAAILAREIRAPGQLVVGSMGPSGEVPAPDGPTDLHELEDAFAEQAQALAEGGVDLLCLETMAHPKELRAALRGVREGAPALGVIASIGARRTTKGYVTWQGFAVEQLLAVALEEHADGVGVNCGLTPAEMLDLVRQLRARTDLPLIARAVAEPTGAPPVSPSTFAEGMLALLAAGATSVGGCCGAGPAHIAAARALLAGAPRQIHELVSRPETL
jgi:methionine synthase I (cobalamin-dependent)